MSLYAKNLERDRSNVPLDVLPSDIDGEPRYRPRHFREHVDQDVERAVERVIEETDYRRAAYRKLCTAFPFATDHYVIGGDEIWHGKAQSVGYASVVVDDVEIIGRGANAFEAVDAVIRKAGGNG